MKQYEMPMELQQELITQAYKEDIDPQIVLSFGMMVLRWISDNPRVPTEAQINDMRSNEDWGGHLNSPNERDQYLIELWQRRCWLKPEPKVPEEIKDLLYRCKADPESVVTVKRTDVDEDLLEAFRRGQKKGA